MSSGFTAGGVLRIIPETLNELRLDVQEIVEFVCEQFGLDDVWNRASTFLQNIRRKALPKQSVLVCGRNRSVIRKIGSRLNLKPPKRYHLRVIDFVRMDDRRIIVCDEKTAEESLCVQNGLQICLEEDFKSNIGLNIRHRWNVSEKMVPLMDGDNDSTFAVSLDPNFSYSQSTPKRAVINRRAKFDAPTDTDKLRAELERLRSQIAAIVSVKELALKSPAPDRKEDGSVDSMRKRGVLPPPPPPPLPSQPLYATIKSTETVALPVGKQDLMNQKTSSCCLRFDLTEILKDIGNVKLRKVDRSPGGTPLRNKTKITSDPNDPAAIMAAALKRRFSHLETLQESFEREQLDLSFSVWDSSDSMTSPFISPVKMEQTNLQHQTIGFVC